MELGQEKVVQKRFVGKLTSIENFRKTYANNVTYQAVQYAMEKGLIDYLQIAPKLRIIVLTDHTLTYQPDPTKGRILTRGTKRTVKK